MAVLLRQVREDFDRIALLTEHYGGASNLYQNYLLRHLPSRCENALEIGCGAGAFTELLAARARRVVAVDLSPQMIRLARQRTAHLPHIEYVLGDVMSLSLPADGYDCVVSIATLHHLPPAQALQKMKDALKPGGTLIIHDLTANEGPVDLGISVLAYPVNLAIRFWETGRFRVPREVREVWAEHGRHDVYLKPTEIREMCRKSLPGAKLRRHLLWRYTVTWRKPGAA